MGLPPMRRFSVSPSSIFHDDEGAAVFLADIVDGANIRMIEGGGGVRFAAETLERLAIFGHFFGKEFQGDGAVQAGVFGFVDHAHAATAEFFENAVVRNGLANHGVCAGILGCGRMQVNAGFRSAGRQPGSLCGVA